MPFLRLYSDQHLQAQWELTADRMSIGRDGGNDIVLQNPGISKHHAYVERQGNLFVVYDNNSSNGLFVNGDRVSRHTLSYRDEIQIFPYKLVFTALPKLPGEEEGRESDFPERVRENATVFVTADAIADSLCRKRKSVDQLVYEGAGGPHVIDKVNFTLGRGRHSDIRCGSWFAPRVAATIQRRNDGCYLIRGRRGQVLRNGAAVHDAVRLKDNDSLLVQGMKLTYYFRPIGAA